jgi:hypothetical protein
MAKKILVFVAAIMALAVVPAAASATNSPELVHQGALVKAGTLIQATNIGATTMKNAAGENLVSCEKAALTGNVTKNEGGNVEGDITAASFENIGAVDCSGILGATRVTPTATTNGLPWCLRSTTTMLTDEFQVRGNSCNNLARPIRFVLHPTLLGTTCTYQRTAAIPGTFTTSSTTSELSISNVEFTLLEGGFGCPATGFLNMKFEMETHGTTETLGLI